MRPFRCPNCRLFSTTARTNALYGPEHPKYIPVPTPPQQDLPSRPSVKGILPIPRDVFTRSNGRDKASAEWLDPATRAPLIKDPPAKGSREEWKTKMSALRRQNLREGLTSLRARRTRDERIQAKRQKESREEHERLLSMPERETDRLTAPSHGLDLDALYSKFPLPDPHRSTRLALKAANVAAAAAQNSHERITHLQTLYSHARNFIVTPAQLDEAVEKAFGTTEEPVRFGSGIGTSGASVWALGKPERVQDLVSRTQKGTVMGGRAVGWSELGKERIRRIGEVLGSGGGMGVEEGKEEAKE